jgi:hypothetical protein
MVATGCKGTRRRIDAGEAGFLALGFERQFMKR